MRITKHDARIAEALCAYKANPTDWRDYIADIAGLGEPASKTYAELLGTDYICAMDDGAIIAWGAEHADGYREIDTFSPEDQALMTPFLEDQS